MIQWNNNTKIKWKERKKERKKVASTHGKRKSDRSQWLKERAECFSVQSVQEEVSWVRKFTHSEHQNEMIMADVLYKLYFVTGKKCF